MNLSSVAPDKCFKGPAATEIVKAAQWQFALDFVAQSENLRCSCEAWGYCSTNWYRDRQERLPTDETAHRDQDTDRDTPSISCLRVQLECEYWAEMARLAHERELA